jgi:hypothetical protein
MKSRILWIFLSFSMTFTLLAWSCDGMEPSEQEEGKDEEEVAVTETTTYTLSVSISPTGAGSVYPTGGEYESGLQVTLTATPASGYAFDCWDRVSWLLWTLIRMLSPTSLRLLVT